MARSNVKRQGLRSPDDHTREPNGLPGAAAPVRASMRRILPSSEPRSCAHRRRVAAVAGAHVQEPVRPELELPAVVVARRCVCGIGRTSRGGVRVGDVGVGRSLELERPGVHCRRSWSGTRRSGRWSRSRAGTRSTTGLASPPPFVRLVTSRKVPPPAILTNPPCSTTNTRGSLGGEATWTGALNRPISTSCGAAEAGAAASSRNATAGSQARISGRPRRRRVARAAGRARARR